MSGTPVRTPPFTPRRRPTSDPSGPTVLEMVEESTLFLDMFAVGAPTLPGFLLCTPGLALFIAPIVVITVLPVVAVGLLAAGVGLVVLVAAVPVLVGRRVARRALRVVAAQRRVTPVHAPESAGATAQPTAL